MVIVPIYAEGTLPETAAGQEADGVIIVKSKVRRLATTDQLLGNPGVVKVIVREVMLNCIRQRRRFIIKVQMFLSFF